MNVRDENYFTVQAWMVTKLKLRTVERDVYAIIYAYCQDGESDYHGSLSYMAELTGYSKNSICTALQKLVHKNLIQKTETFCNNIKYCSYTTTLDGIQGTCTGIQGTCTKNKENKKVNLSKDKLQNKTKEQFFSLKQKEKSPSLFMKCSSLIEDFTDNEELKKALMHYLRVRLEIKDKPLYANSWKGLLNKLNREFSTTEEKLETVYQSIERGYASFFPVGTKKYMETNKMAYSGEKMGCSAIPYGQTLEGIPHDGRYDNEDHTRSGLIF